MQQVLLERLALEQLQELVLLLEELLE